MKVDLPSKSTKASSFGALKENGLRVFYKEQGIKQCHLPHQWAREEKSRGHINQRRKGIQWNVMKITPKQRGMKGYVHHSILLIQKPIDGFYHHT